MFLGLGSPRPKVAAEVRTFVAAKESARGEGREGRTHQSLMCCGGRPSLSLSKNEPCGPCGPCGPSRQARQGPSRFHLTSYTYTCTLHKTRRRDKTQPTRMGFLLLPAPPPAACRTMQAMQSTRLSPGSGPSCRVSVRLAPTTDAHHLAVVPVQYVPGWCCPLSECVCARSCHL